MPLMASLWTGTSGITTASNALNTTAHNITNVDTEGYTRQQVTQGTRHYNTITKTGSANAYQQIGLGVEYTSCRQVRSVFLDQSYRTESGRAAFYNVSYDCLVETQDLLQEMDGAEFLDSLNNLWSAIQDLDREPGAVSMNTLVSRASEFVNRAQQVYTGLTNYQDNLDSTIAGYVKTINTYGDQISTLNQKIVQVEAGGREHANDLRDERNLLLDKLAELGKITYDEDIFGNVSVYFEDVPFVLTDHVNHMAVDQGTAKGGSSEGFATPYWEFMATRQFDPEMNSGKGGYITTDITNAKVFDLSQEISSAANTDVGKLRSVLLARGDHYATYHDIMMDDDTIVNKKTGEASLISEQVKAGNIVYDNDKLIKQFYSDNISQSVIMNVEAELDQMFHNIVERVNEVFENAASNPARKNPEMYVENYDVLAADVTNGVAGAEDKLNAAVNEAAKQFRLFDLLQDDNKGVVRYDIGNYNSIGRFEGYGSNEQSDWMIRLGSTTMNVGINQTLVRNPAVFSMKNIEGEDDKLMTEALKQVFKDEKYTLNPSVATETNFLDYYSSLVAQVANSGYVYDSITDQQTITVNQIRDAREQIVGVSSDEELENMIKFQNAYNAASRYINVVSEMLEHLVNTLGS